MGPVWIPQEPFLTNISTENTSVPFLYPLLGLICHFRFFGRTVASENSFVTHLYCHIKFSRKSILFDDGSSSCIWSTSLIIYMPCYLWPTIVCFMVCFSIFCLFSTLFFLYGDDDNKKLFFPFQIRLNPARYVQYEEIIKRDTSWVQTSMYGLDAIRDDRRHD